VLSVLNIYYLLSSCQFLLFLIDTFCVPLIDVINLFWVIPIEYKLFCIFRTVSSVNKTDYHDNTRIVLKCRFSFFNEKQKYPLQELRQKFVNTKEQYKTNNNSD
jgi:hypothetical protein